MKRDRMNIKWWMAGAAKQRKDESRGYEWARSAHIDEGMSIDEIYSKVAFAFDYTAFDKGAERYLHAIHAPGFH